MMELDKDRRTTDPIDRLLSDLAWAREQKQANILVAPLEAQVLQLKDEVGDEWARAERAVVLVAELKAENKRLKVCGNCTLRYDAPPRIGWDGHECASRWNGVDGDWDDEDSWPMVKCGDPCHFTPSRWTERDAP